jgi:hypothetical protein
MKCQTASRFALAILDLTFRMLPSSVKSYLSSTGSQLGVSRAMFRKLDILYEDRVFKNVIYPWI